METTIHVLKLYFYKGMHIVNFDLGCVGYYNLA